MIFAQDGGEGEFQHIRYLAVLESAERVEGDNLPLLVGEGLEQGSERQQVLLGEVRPVGKLLLPVLRCHGHGAAALTQELQRLVPRYGHEPGHRLALGAVLRCRLEGRGTDAPEVIESRIAKAEYELSFAPQFDCVIVNDDLETAKAEALKVIKKFLEA